MTEDLKNRCELSTNFILASLITGYPDEFFCENVNMLLTDPDLSIPVELRTSLEKKLSKVEDINDLRSEYIDLFDRGRSTNSLYETEYGRDRAMGKGKELSDLAGFYKAFGLEFGEEGTTREMLDHVSVELEFYALLLIKHTVLVENADANGTEIVLDARSKFLKDHLGRFSGIIGDRPGVKDSAFYSLVFQWCKELVQEECKNLNVTPEPNYWVPGEQEKEEICCGASGANLK